MKIDEIKQSIKIDEIKQAIKIRNGCNCKFCINYDKYMWAVISECGCGCHDSLRPTGHDGLCCEFPNAIRAYNPYSDLKSASYYNNIIKLC